MTNQGSARTSFIFSRGPYFRTYSSYSATCNAPILFVAHALGSLG